jgi:NADH-quinone oxidoreductase subunit N
MMTIFMLSLAGFPSTIGFMGKFYIFVSAIESGHVYIALLGVFVAFVSIFYYFRLIAMMYFNKDEGKEQEFAFDTSTTLIFLMALLTVTGGIGMGLIPYLPSADGFMDIAREAIGSLVR